jgi:hypothetical protein
MFKNDRFAKTGSGQSQTHGQLTTREACFRRPADPRRVAHLPVGDLSRLRYLRARPRDDRWIGALRHTDGVRKPRFCAILWK